MNDGHSGQDESDFHARTVHCERPDGRRVAYAEFGKVTAAHRVAVLYFHTTGSCRIEAAPLARVARAHHVRIVALDRPGFGESTFQEHRQLADWPADALAVADTLGLARFIVCGLNAGAAHAVAVALAEPERVAAVLCANPLPDPGHPAFRQQPRLFRSLLTSPRLQLWFYRRFMTNPDKYLGSGFLIGDFEKRLVVEYKGLVRRMFQEGLRQGIDGLQQELELLAKPWGLDWSRLTPPLHVVCSLNDGLYHFARGLSQEQAAASYDELPGGRLAALTLPYCDLLVRTALRYQ